MLSLKKRLKGAAAVAMAAGFLVAMTSCEVPGDRDVVLPGTPGALSKVVSYGPYAVPAAKMKPGAASMDDMDDMEEGMITNDIRRDVEKPCTDCYVTGITASLHYPDGRPANVDTDTMLHHMVLSDSTRPDPTCPKGLFGVFKTGERFFASGNERTYFNLPSGYGIPVEKTANWILIADLMNMNMAVQNLVIDVKFEYVPKSAPGMKPVTAVWLDVDQCGDSEVPAKPEVTYDYQSNWQVNVPGHIVLMGGHVHDGGTVLQVFNDTKQWHLCNSVARYGQYPQFVDHHGNGAISSMSKCSSPGTNPINNLDTGDNIRIVAKYDTAAHKPHGTHPVMGIAVLFVAPR